MNYYFVIAALKIAPGLILGRGFYPDITRYVVRPVLIT